MNPRVLQILIVILGVGILGFGGYQAYKIAVKPAIAPKPTTKPLTLSDYAGSQTAKVRFSIIGPVTAPEKHTEQVFTISQSSRQLEIFKNYSNNADYSQTYNNNAAAFADFMRALQNNGYIKSTKSSVNSEVGACPTGTRYTYELIDDGSTVIRTWFSSCGIGTFDGNAGTVQTLFLNQIPDYYKIPSNLRS